MCLCLSVALLLSLSLHLSVCLSASLPLCRSAALPLCRSAAPCRSAALPLCLSAALPLCLSISVFVSENAFFHVTAPGSNQCWTTRVTVEYGTIPSDSSTVNRSQSIDIMKQIGSAARSRLYACPSITLGLGQVHIDTTNGTTSIIGTFHLEHQPFGSLSQRNVASNCINSAGAFVNALISPASSAPKVDGVYAATRASKTDYVNGTCCDSGSVLQNGECGE